MIRYIRSTILPSKPAQLLIQTGLKWNQENCSAMAAALSYYALFSLFPMLLAILSVVGSLIGPNTEAFQYIKEVVQRYLPPEVHDLVKATVTTLNQNSTGAGIIGFGLLLSSASTVFAVLRSAVNKIWRSNTPASPSESIRSIRNTVVSFVLNQLLAFLLVLGTTLLLLTSLISNIAIKTILKLERTSGRFIFFDSGSGYLHFIQNFAVRLRWLASCLVGYSTHRFVAGRIATIS